MEDVILKELENLTNNISTITNKVDEIDTLKKQILNIEDEIAKIKTVNVTTPEKVKNDAKKDFGDFIKKAVTTGTTGASYTLPEEILGEVQDMINNYGVVARISRTIPMTSKTLKIPIAGAVNVYYPDEATDITASDNIFINGLTLTAKKQAGFVQISREMLTWSEVQLANYVSELLARDMASEEDKQALLGTGIPFTGIGYNTGVPAVVGSSTGYSWIDGEKIIEALSLIDGDYQTSDVAIIMNSVVFYNVFLKQKKLPGTSGGYAIEAMVNLNPPTIAGYRVFLSKVMPNFSNGAGLPYVVIGNFANAHFRGVGQEITIEISRDYDFKKDVISIKATRLHSVGNVITKAFSRLVSASS